MKFVCDRCQTKYSIADDKVRGKVLKVRCKTCQNVITVREAGAKPSVGGLAPVRTSQQPSAPMSTLGESHEDPSERTAIAASPLGLMADVAQGRRPTPPPPPPLGDGIEWFLALEGAQQGPFTRKLLVDKLFALPKEADVHVWNDQMDGWKPPAEVPDVARDLNARRVPALPTRPPAPRHTPLPPAPPA
ncbi:MAG TPA: zinc-ribbon domain-containing protein [Polyangia bacterium]|nr:zinc-ribbon domain-containing protein [Polyangia bacterium]